MRERGKGRPLTVICEDDTRYAVALIAAQISYYPARKTKKVPLRQAAMYATLFMLGYTVDSVVHHSGPPPENYTQGAMQRKAPVKPEFRNGYTEATYMNPGDTDDYRKATADVLRHKFKAWKKRPDGILWLKHMSYAWACALYPRTISAKSQCDPEIDCLRAAELAGERDFAEKVLLPHLHEQRHWGRW